LIVKAFEWRALELKRQGRNSECAIFVENKGLKYVQFKNLKKYDSVISHCFTTRIGGVSTGECATLNLGFNRNDKKENVEENYRRVCSAVGIDYGSLVFSNQVHDNKIKIVDENDRGKGIIIKSDIIGYDGLVTGRKGVTLVTFYADCVPLFFFDSEKRVIALAHSGWRGTVKQIARETLKVMKESFGCDAENIEVAIGPSIGRCCFEVGDEVRQEFADKLEWSEDYCTRAAGGKWYFDLQGIILKTLMDSGVKKDKICVADMCTKCHGDIFFSHRRDRGRTGSMAAIMQIKSI